VTATTPAANETNVPRDLIVRVTLSEAISRPTVDATTVMLRESATGLVVATDVGVDASGRVVVVTPRALLTAYTQYYLTVSGLRDTAGNTVSALQVFFTTGAVTGDAGQDSAAAPAGTPPPAGPG